MGTNYYTKEKKCKACGHKPDGIHLGKSSGGWQFIFQYNGGQYYKNVAEMKEWLKDKIIEDEYGQLIRHTDFWKQIENPERKKMLNHTIEMQKEGETSHAGVLIDGYSFTTGEFS
jgi:hypothetical protein